MIQKIKKSLLDVIDMDFLKYNSFLDILKVYSLHMEHLLKMDNCVLYVLNILLSYIKSHLCILIGFSFHYKHFHNMWIV